MRPAVFQVGGTLYWTILTRNPDTGVLKDADSTPSIAVRKNGASVGDSVTITKRSATTGIYDCSYNPAAEVEGDSFTFEESATVTGTTTSSATYNFSWAVRAIRTGAVELDSATQTQLDSIETDVAALAAAGEITITSPVVDMGADGLPVKIEIVQGADYLLADSTQIAMSLTGTFPAWTSASAYLDILCGGVELSLTGTITTATGGTRALYFELTATQSATLVDSTKDTPSQDIGVFDLRVVLSNTHVTYPINRGKFVSRRRSQA